MREINTAAGKQARGSKFTSFNVQDQEPVTKKKAEDLFES